MSASSISLWVPLAVLGVLLGSLLVVGRVPVTYNVRNLLVRWPMTLLTGLAFTLVIALLTLMLAFVNGMGKLTEQSGHPENVIVLADGSDDESFSNLPLNETADVAFQPGVKRWKKDANDSQGTPLCSRELYVIGTMPVHPQPGAASGTPLQGILNKVLVDQKQILVTDSDGTDHALRLDPTTQVLVNGVPQALENLKPDDAVWIAYDNREGQAWATEVRSSTKTRFIQIRGLEDPLVSAQVHGLELASGAWFSPAGVVALPDKDGRAGQTAVQAVIGGGLARELGAERKPPRALAVGDMFELGPKMWQVVGILNSEGTTFDSEVWAKRAYVGQLYHKPDNLSSLVIRTDSPANAEALVTDLKNNYKKTNLQPLTEPDYYAKLRGISTQLYAGILFLTFFMAIGGAIGVMNTMYAAISTRIKDIGVLRIVGFARWQILVSFLFEALVIGLIGGAIGVAIGSLCDGISATSIVGSGQGGFGKTVIFRLTVNATTIGIGLLLTLLMGLAGGLLPSLTAMRLRPLDAVR